MRILFPDVGDVFLVGRECFGIYDIGNRGLCFLSTSGLVYTTYSNWRRMLSGKTVEILAQRNGDAE